VEAGRAVRTRGSRENPSEELTYLGRATNRCLDRDPRDILALGLAHKAIDNFFGACDAFRTVLASWGEAKPRSVTAERARRENWTQ